MCRTNRTKTLEICITVLETALMNFFIILEGTRKKNGRKNRRIRNVAPRQLCPTPKQKPSEMKRSKKEKTTINAYRTNHG